MNRYRIAALPGDGIGKEIMPEALKVIQAAADGLGTFEFQIEQYPWGAEHYLETGEIMPQNGVETLSQFDAIYFVAAGNPQVTDYLASWEFVLVMRKQFQEYVNVRPVRSWPDVPILLAQQQDIDFIIVRENSEGEYAGPGGVVHPDQINEVAIQTSIFTRHAVQRVARYAFELARKRRGRVTNVTKSNAMLHGLVFWDKVVKEVSLDYSDVEYELLLVDAATMKFIQNPQWFDVIVTTNAYGDILSDLGGAMVGSIGLSPSGNINPERGFPSMFEPVHGSAPDIAGRGIANPIGTILSGAMMLDHLGEPLAAQIIEQAVATVLAQGLLPFDLGGTATTSHISEAIAKQVATLCQLEQ